MEKSYFILENNSKGMNLSTTIIENHHGVLIEAKDENEAWKKALALKLVYDYDRPTDCVECCGSRWSESDIYEVNMTTKEIVWKS